jgi:hypothetical protein
MPDVASSVASRQTFATALFVGLLWGIAAATVIAAMTAFFVAGRDIEMGAVLLLALEAAVWTAMVASALAIFPIGPITGVVGWQLYRRGVVSPWAYAGVGALSAAVAPVLVLVAALESMRYPTTNYAVIDEGVVPLFVAAFAGVGAFAGFMAGRVIKRGAQGA